MSDIIYYWSDGTWCYSDDLEEYVNSGMSDDYLSLKVADCDDRDIDHAVRILLEDDDF